MPTRTLDPISTPTLNRQLTMTNALDLTTINTLEVLAKDLIRNKVCEIEQRAHDADERGMIEFSKQLKQAAREMEFISHQLCSAFTELFIDELDRQLDPHPPKTSGHGAVKLPDLSQPEAIDATAVSI